MSKEFRVLAVVCLLALGVLALTACGGGGSPLPTPRPAEDVGTTADSAAKDSYQATWEGYLRDSIAAENQREGIKLSMLQRYEKPSITAQNTGGLLKETELVEDRTVFNLLNSATTASALAEFDIRITFVDGDTDTRTCKIQVSIEQDPETKLWYVINPGPLPIFNVCAKS